MATTSPDNIWTPDAGDDYALTVDLAAMADTVQEAIIPLRRVATGTVDTIAGDYVTVNFPAGRFTVPPSVTTSGGIQSAVGVPRVVSVTRTSFRIRVWNLATGEPVDGVGISWQAIER